MNIDIEMLKSVLESLILEFGEFDEVTGVMKKEQISAIDEAVILANELGLFAKDTERPEPVTERLLPDDGALCVVWDDECNKDHYFLCKFESDGPRFQMYPSGGCFYPDEISGYQDTRIRLSAKDEPAAEWDGEGLPPVGCDCEVSVLEQPRIDASICAYSGDKVWLYATGYGDIVEKVSACAFTRKRTKAEREREELEYIIETAYGVGGVKAVADAIQSNCWQLKTE